MRNVARTWAYETGCLVGDEMSANLPYNDYYEYYAPDYELDVRPSNMDNANSKEYLDKILKTVLENLRQTQHAPSVQMTDVPPSLAMNDDDEAALDDLDEDENPDKRITQRRFDKRIEKNGELSESEDEDMAEANGVRRQNGNRKRRQFIDHRNLRDPLDSAADSGLGTPQPASEADEMNVDTAAGTPTKPAEKTDGADVAMGDVDDAADSMQVEAGGTAFKSGTTPASAEEAIKIKTEMAAEDTAAAAREEGLQEREEANAEGEARTEAAKTE